MVKLNNEGGDKIDKGIGDRQILYWAWNSAGRKRDVYHYYKGNGANPLIDTAFNRENVSGEEFDLFSGG